MRRAGHYSYSRLFPFADLPFSTEKVRSLSAGLSLRVLARTCRFVHWHHAMTSYGLIFSIQYTRLDLLVSTLLSQAFFSSSQNLSKKFISLEFWISNQKLIAATCEVLIYRTNEYIYIFYAMIHLFFYLLITYVYFLIIDLSRRFIKLMVDFCEIPAGSWLNAGTLYVGLRGRTQ